MDDSKKLESENENKINELYSKTTVALEEKQEKELQEISELWDSITDKTYGHHGKYFGKTFNEIQKKLSLDEIKDLLETKKELDDLKSDPFIANEKWDIIRHNRWQKEHLENALEKKEELEKEYNLLIEDFKFQYGSVFLDFPNFPNFENIQIKKINREFAELDFAKKDRDYIHEDHNNVYSRKENIEKEINKVKGTLLKIGLKKLELALKEVNSNLESKRGSGNLIQKIDSELAYGLGRIYDHSEMGKIYPYLRIGNPSIGKLFSKLQEDRPLSEDRISKIEIEKELEEKIKEFERKVR